ncbi:HAD family hydrolase, partial [Salmonella sp. SAL4435]|uniref:HAD family hydrolase n=1 Tax=Salmonella sp. SAL4435 TaxID=3159890 RepID=UPI00397888F8
MEAATVDALKRFKTTGRRLILVTGRELDDLKAVFPELTMFDCVVAENGALLYDPATDKERVIADPPPTVLIDRLNARKVAPLS